MTDKIQKIREEAEKLKSQLLRGACSSQIAMETMCKEEAYNEVLAILNTVQEEPVSNDLERAAIIAADEDMQGRQIMEESNENRQLYSRIFRRGFKAGAKWKDMQKEFVSEDLEEAAHKYADIRMSNYETAFYAFMSGAKWKKSNLWKPAYGDDLPEIDREVIALLDNGKVVFAHRPPEYWDGKDIVTGKVTRNYPKTYDKGGWNIPNVKCWLDIELPKEIEL